MRLAAPDAPASKQATDPPASGQTPKQAPDPDEQRDIICGKCGSPLRLTEQPLDYLGHHFKHKLPSCRDCGNIYISKGIATGKMQEVEKAFEDK